MTMNVKSMRAVGVIPSRRELALLAHPEPRLAEPRQLKIRTLEVGICGTDREICSFASVTSPNASWPSTRYSEPSGGVP